MTTKTSTTRRITGKDVSTVFIQHLSVLRHMPRNSESDQKLIMFGASTTVGMLKTLGKKLTEEERTQVVSAVVDVCRYVTGSQHTFEQMRRLNTEYAEMANAIIEICGVGILKAIPALNVEDVDFMPPRAGMRDPRHSRPHAPIPNVAAFGNAD